MKPRLTAAVLLAAATLVLFLVVIAMGGAFRAGLAPWPGIAVVVIAACALSGNEPSLLVAGLLAASGVVGLDGLVGPISSPPPFPGPIFGVIIGLPLVGLSTRRQYVPRGLEALDASSPLPPRRPSTSPNPTQSPQSDRG